LLGMALEAFACGGHKKTGNMSDEKNSEKCDLGKTTHRKKCTLEDEMKIFFRTIIVPLTEVKKCRKMTKKRTVSYPKLQ